jgi:hypothetical protein
MHGSSITLACLNPPMSFLYSHTLIPIYTAHAARTQFVVVKVIPYPISRTVGEYLQPTDCDNNNNTDQSYLSPVLDLQASFFPPPSHQASSLQYLSYFVDGSV